jgi:cytochrome c oxidase accessory protein FixG
MTTSSRRDTELIQRWRRRAEVLQGVLVLGLPFVRLRGESALRFDLSTLRLHFFGSALWMNEGFVVLAATLFASFLFLTITVAFGRVWCGWSCPQTLLTDLTAPLERWRRKGGSRAAGAVLGVAAVSAVVGANLVWYFVSPYDFFRELAAGSLGPVTVAFWSVLSLTVFADLTLLRARFCATACPYAKLQGAFFDAHTLVVAYDEARAADCIDCGACVRVCPTGIDIRHGLQMQCIACAECVDACRPIMLRLKRPTRLIAYFYGAPGRAARLGRPVVLALAAATAASLVLTVSVAAGRTPLDFVASPATRFSARRGADGRSINAYEVSLENRSAASMRVTLSVCGRVDATLRPTEVSLDAGEHRRLTAVVELPASARPEVHLALCADAAGARLSRSVPFAVVESP